MLSISTQDQNLLVQQNSLKKLETNLYLQDTSNDNYQYIKEKFFLYETDDKCKLLNIWCGIFSTISDVFSFYVGDTDLDIDISFGDLTRDLTTLGFCVIWLERVDKKLQMIYQPAKNYWQENWVDKIWRLYQDDDSNIYVLVQSYLIGSIENKLYLTKWGTLNWAEEVSLDTIPQTADLYPIVQTNLDTPALIIIEDSSVSIIEKVIPLVYGIDRQVIMNHTQYLQNLESFVLMKNIRRPEKLLEQYDTGKTIDFSQIGRIVNGGEDSSIEFVNNVNTLIDKAITESDNHIRRISSLTTVPIEFLGLDSNEGSVGLGSRTLRHWAFMKRVEYLRSLFDEAIKIFLTLSKQEETIYTRPDVFVKTDWDLAEELKVAREAEIISQFRAIKKYGKLTDEETQEELDRMDSDVLDANDWDNEDNEDKQV